LSWLPSCATSSHVAERQPPSILLLVDASASMGFSLPSGESLYSLPKEDRHHLTCLRCGNSISIDECPVHELEHELQHHHKFRIYYHTLEFFGLCPDCQAKEEAATG